MKEFSFTYSEPFIGENLYFFEIEAETKEEAIAKMKKKIATNLANGDMEADCNGWDVLFDTDDKYTGNTELYLEEFDKAPEFICYNPGQDINIEENE